MPLEATGVPGRIVTRAAPTDLALFDDVLTGAGVPVTVLPAQVTSAFGMHYEGDDRTMTVDAVGPSWEADDIDAARIATTWVHVAPLLRSDFTPGAIARLVAGGHRVAYDGQGLVRVAAAGPLRVDAAFDPALLAGLQILKLADDEATVLTGRPTFTAEDAARFGVPEVIVTHGSRGCDLFFGGEHHVVPPAFRVTGVHATGAGDTFAVAYVAARSRGDDPLQAAVAASQLVAELLLVRREASGG
ncbi:MAG: hypothetical protein JHD16_17060 [Solirubrobacteraceae bacterium]|nr:hypothetical protein [Solirubrobacteraceae bacterium]